MFRLHREIFLALGVKLALLYGIHAAFFSAPHQVTVDGSALNWKLGLPGEIDAGGEPVGNPAP